MRTVGLFLTELRIRKMLEKQDLSITKKIVEIDNRLKAVETSVKP